MRFKIGIDHILDSTNRSWHGIIPFRVTSF